MIKTATIIGNYDVTVFVFIKRYPRSLQHFKQHFLIRLHLTPRFTICVMEYVLGFGFLALIIIYAFDLKAKEYVTGIFKFLLGLVICATLIFVIVRFVAWAWHF